MSKNIILDIGLFEYQFRPIELAWAALQGVAAFVVATTTAPVSPQDWESWAIAAGAAAARPVFALIFGKRPEQG